MRQGADWYIEGFDSRGSRRKGFCVSIERLMAWVIPKPTGINTGEGLEYDVALGRNVTSFSRPDSVVRGSGYP
jgi:hypothetical protein